MAKQTNTAQKLALEALAQALLDPTPKVMFGSAKVPGFFKGAAAGPKAAAKLCEERGWLVTTGEMAGKGKSQKPTYRLTPEGAKAALEGNEALVLLSGVNTALSQQAETLRGLHVQVSQMLSGIQPLADTVSQLAQRMQPPDLSAMLGTLQPSPAPATTSVKLDWLDEAVKLATEQKQRDHYQPLSLPALFAVLRSSRPALTLGQYHDGLRALRDAGRVRLLPFTRALATIEDPRNALFLDGEVMVYVEPS